MSAATARAAAPRSQAKLVFFLVFFAVTIFVTFMKNREILNPASPVAQHFEPAKWFLAAHGFFAALALVLGAFQFSNRLRARFLPLHRFLGYVYVVSVFVGAPMAIPVAARVDTPSLVAASVVQTLGWMLTTAIALYCIRTGNVVQHRRWMIRGYPFAMVFTVARIIIPIPPILRTGFTGIEIVVWTAIALAAFLPNIFLEWRSIAPRSRQTTA
jgi:uncharacterized membrane protein